MKIINKITAIVLSIILIYSCSTTYFAYEINDNTTEIEFSIEELESGIDIIAYYTSDGKVNIVKSTDKTPYASNSDVEAVFSVSLTKAESSKAILSWNAVATALKNVTGTIYCKDTSILLPHTYCSSTISCPYLDGTEGRANAGTAPFTVSNKSAKYRVGYSNINLRAISKDYYFGNGSSVVTK